MRRRTACGTVAAQASYARFSASSEMGWGVDWRWWRPRDGGGCGCVCTKSLRQAGWWLMPGSSCARSSRQCSCFSLARLSTSSSNISSVMPSVGFVKAYAAADEEEDDDDVNDD